MFLAAAAAAGGGTVVGTALSVWVETCGGISVVWRVVAPFLPPAPSLVGDAVVDGIGAGGAVLGTPMVLGFED